MESDSHIPQKHQERTWSIYGKSVPQLFLERVETRRDAVAFRYKDLGLYQEVTWRQYGDDVEAFALGLLSLGAERGGRIAVMGDACFEYFVSDLAGLCVGAITYGIYTTCSVAEVRHQLEHGGVRMLIPQNQEYVDKVPARNVLANQLNYIIVADMRAMFLYRDER